MPDPSRQLLSGWGRTAPSAATVVRPAGPDGLGQVGHILAKTGGAAVIARGLGRSYGDAAQCAGGTVVDMTAMSAIGPIDPVSGRVSVQAGVSVHDLVARALPEGWFVPVSPGTRHVTVGGAIAADIHGKNHHRDGSFARHVRSLRLVAPAGVLDIGPEHEPDVFWATAGGMGLTGIVVEATVGLIPVETSWMQVDTDRLGDLDSLMAAMADTDATTRYSVAWLDCTVTGRRLGRGILTRGDHASLSDLDARRRHQPRRPPGDPRLHVPREAPAGMLNRTTIAAFNELWFRKAPRRRERELQTVGTFFHPLDGVADWNLLYGPRGFVQYQLAVGPEHGETVRRALVLLAEGGAASFLTVLKRFGPADAGPLSFPLEGWTLALDIPVGSERLPGLLDRIDELVAEVGGRVYLAKDSRLRPELLAAMYPRLGELERVRRRLDPGGVLVSDLARRLRLAEGRGTP